MTIKREGEGEVRGERERGEREEREERAFIF
jgi:hypothetical protein